MNQNISSIEAINLSIDQRNGGLVINAELNNNFDTLGLSDILEPQKSKIALCIEDVATDAYSSLWNFPCDSNENIDYQGNPPLKNSDITTYVNQVPIYKVPDYNTVKSNCFFVGW